jgi:hypothetical protein
MQSIVTEQDLMNILNIILNLSTGLTFSLISNFQNFENTSLFVVIMIKYTKLTHLIDGKLTNELEGINNEFIQYLINKYGAMTSECECICPLYIRKQNKKSI